MTDPSVTITPARSYLTIAEYKNAPHGIDTSNLVPGGTTAQNDKELANVIARASGWADDICHQVLAPTSDTERRKVRAGKLGQAFVKTDAFPIIRVTSIRSTDDPRRGWDTANLAAVTVLADVRFFEAFLGLYGGREWWVEYVYENGYPNTTLSAGPSQGATSISVADTLGIYSGQELTIYDGDLTERVIVAPGYTPGTNPVPLTAGLANPHVLGVAVSALPPAVKEAAILLTSLLIRNRSVEGVVLEDVMAPPRLAPPGSVLGSEDFLQAKDLLHPYTTTFRAR